MFLVVPFMYLGCRWTPNNVFAEAPATSLSQQYIDDHILFIYGWNHSFLSHVCLGAGVDVLITSLLSESICSICSSFLTFLIWYFPHDRRVEPITTLVKWWIKMVEGSGWETKELPVCGALVIGPCYVGFYCLKDTCFFPGFGPCFW